MIEEIELNFDVSLNTMMVRYYQLTKTYHMLSATDDHELNEEVRLYLLENVSKELEHIDMILNKEIPNELKAKKAPGG